MKKYLTLIAIMSLLASYAMAEAPVYTGVPDVKLFAGKSLSAAFDLEAYNTKDAATTWGVVTGTDVATFDIAPSSPSYFGLVEASSTWRNVSFKAENEGGVGYANQLVKYSSFLVKKLGRVSLAGSVDTASIDLSASVNTAASPSYPGAAVWPASFDAAGAVSADAGITADIDTTAKALIVSNAAPLSGKKLVRIEAAPGTSPNLADYDKGILQVYPNLLTNGKFDVNSSNWSFQPYVTGYTTGNISIVAGPFLGKTNVLKIDQAVNNNCKFTQIVPATAGTWYTARLKVATDAAVIANSKQKIYLYIQDLGAGGAIARSAHDIIQPGQMDAGVWNPMELSFYARETQIAVQCVSIVQGSASAGAATYWDDIEVFAAPPEVADAELTYGNTEIPVINGGFETDTSGWSYQSFGATTGTGVVSWVSAQTGQNGVVKIAQGSNNAIKMTQAGLASWGMPFPMAEILTADKSAKLSLKVLSSAATGATGKYYLYIYSNTDTTVTTIKRSVASIIQPGALPGTTWETIQIGGIPRTAFTSIQGLLITPGSKAAQNIYVDDFALASDKDPIYFWDSTLFP